MPADAVVQSWLDEIDTAASVPSANGRRARAAAVGPAGAEARRPARARGRRAGSG
jgi:hypothetical protein